MSPSYRIVFYVSGHGFGHAARAIEVIREIQRSAPAIEIILKTSAPKALFDAALDQPITHVPLQCDAGIAQIDSLRIDDVETVRRACEFQRQFAQLAGAEANDLRDRGVSVVVGDIPPLAFAAAHAAGLPSVGIGNFTWDWIYEAYGELTPADLVHDIRSCYQTATKFLRLPMAGGFATLESRVRDIPFIAIRPTRSADDVRRALGIGERARGKPVVLMAFGGHGLFGVDQEALASIDRYLILTVSEKDLSPNGIRYQELVAAVDVVATKPGYGIITEAIVGRTAMLYTSRGRFAEYDVLVREMPRYIRSRFIEPEDLLSGKWEPALDALLKQPSAPETPALNGASIAAEEILQYLM